MLGETLRRWLVNQTDLSVKCTANNNMPDFLLPRVKLKLLLITGGHLIRKKGVKSNHYSIGKNEKSK